MAGTGVEASGDANMTSAAPTAATTVRAALAAGTRISEEVGL